MSLTDQLRDEIERSFADEPPPCPVERRLADGHRALRRRRVAGAVAVCGVVAVLGSAYAVGSSGPDRDASRIIASDAPSPTATASATGPAAPWEDDTPIRYVSGELEIRDGVVVHERIHNPYGDRPGHPSDALDLTYHGQRIWIIAEVGDNGFGYASSVPTPEWATFRDWVDDQVALDGGGPSGYPRTMLLADDGRVVPTPDTRVLQRTDHPDLGPGFAPPGATVGAAIVQPNAGTTSYFVVWRVIDGKLDVISTRPRDAIGATFDELLNAARTRYASGEGLR